MAAYVISDELKAKLLRLSEMCPVAREAGLGEALVDVAEEVATLSAAANQG